jgi:3-hydroxyisobutyrate dehydrogenase-like beta-hydroxyacid dehydrogenase
MTSKRIALLGLGEVGAILAADLIARGHTEIAAYDKEFRSPGSKASLSAAGLAVQRAASAPEAVSGAYLVISAVTASSAVEAAREAARGLSKGAFYLDINSCSPESKATCADVVEKCGARFVEAVVMTPIMPRRLQSPMLLGGPHARAFLEAAAALDLKADIVSEDIGVAAASKLCRSVIVKGMEALVTEALVAARSYGVEASVIASLADLMPHQNWRQFARYMICRSIEHGVRRAEEMAEAASTVEKTGIEPLMSRAIAERQLRAATQQHALAAEDLNALLDALAGFDRKASSIANTKEAKSL